MRAKNTSGVSDFVTDSFTVKPAPPAPRPPPSTRPTIEVNKIDWRTIKVTGSKFLPSHVVWIKVTVYGILYNSYGTSIIDSRGTVPWLKFSSDEILQPDCGSRSVTALSTVIVDGLTYSAVFRLKNCP